MENTSKRSEAQKQADKKYQKKILSEGKKKRILIEVKPEDFDMINEFTENMHMSRTQAVIHAIRYCMDNNIRFLK